MSKTVGFVQFCEWNTMNHIIIRYLPITFLRIHSEKVSSKVKIRHVVSMLKIRYNLWMV